MKLVSERCTVLGPGIICKISNTRKSVSSEIQILRNGSKIEVQAKFVFNQLQSVLISDETLFLLFDIASHNVNNSWRNSKQKFTKFYDN